MVTRIDHRALDVPQQHVLDRLAVKDRHAGQQMVQRAAQAVDVAAVVGVPLADPLGGDVEGRAHALAAHLHPAEPRQPEVHQFGHPLLVQQHVARLDVAVDQTDSVGRLEPLGHGNGDFQAAGLADRLVLVDQLANAPPADQFHHQVGHVVVHAHGEDPHYVAVAQGGQGAGLGEKAVHRVVVSLGLQVHDLDGHLAVQLAVDAAIGRRRGAFAQQSHQAVLPQVHRDEHPPPTGRTAHRRQRGRSRQVDLPPAGRTIDVVDALADLFRALGQ
ncbi:MAG: hypothetical protein BWX88_05321 [Planctomycetes bacterium ADurb.Bin126]|nr:MAG: hypothetical protein BWX88_05321 [Planctomycetes bacterium ADurb.Bin126]